MMEPLEKIALEQPGHNATILVTPTIREVAKAVNAIIDRIEELEILLTVDEYEPDLNPERKLELRRAARRTLEMRRKDKESK